MWNEKLVVIAGGSKGLGLHIAKEFHERGCFVVILARDSDQIEATVNDLNGIRSESAFGWSVDLTVDQARDETIEKIVGLFDRIDVWVNAIGRSIRADFLSTKLDKYREWMEANFFASVGCSLAAIPILQRSNGHLVNIGSLAAKTAWPCVGPYVTSKHALSGFAHQLRLEGPSEVHYLFVCTGPIANSDQHRYQQQAEGLAGKANQPGAGAPVKAIEPKKLASKIVVACEQRSNELIVPSKSRLLFAVLQIWPSLGDRLIRKFCK